jgi:hypothetical protein
MAAPQDLVAWRGIAGAAEVAAELGYEADGLAEQYGSLDAVFFA